MKNNSNKDKYDAIMACIATYRVFVMVTKVLSFQYHQETSNVIEFMAFIFLMFYLILKHMYVNFLQC
jgi:hypothetical protein